MSTDTFDPTDAPAGIQHTVDLFTAQGFVVIAASDDPNHDCDDESCLYTPWLALRVSPDKLIESAKDIVALLLSYNVVVQQEPDAFDEDEPARAADAFVTATYDPVVDEALITVFNINDKRMGIAHAQNN
jgi:hypothetical protein